MEQKENKALELAIQNVKDIKALFDSAQKGKENDKWLSTLLGQICRSSSSVVLNISENTDHISQPMRLQKLNIALGENCESKANLSLALSLGYFKDTEYAQRTLDNLEQVRLILNKSIWTIKQKIAQKSKA